ncbi:PQQ-binding-like beta-propeller repeat protein [Gemmata sp. JC717]|uniref:outer membrane protein assembly factor BamB family protein n=1 Tax=Gemmata algarum TaxID=2975278 RepID=UPI0021BAA24E|nr:PQQ-binding-like beta-propeller repeat protein [Gemmata algarum]MDY3556922.1 PQQ-binding-like beta-propeller repeat protein [Gemmata algarum]
MRLLIPLFGALAFLALPACAPVATAATTTSPLACAGTEPLLTVTEGLGSPALLGVIPSFVLIGPLAVVAALFPGVFARLAIGMRRWRAFLVVASLNSTLALVYFALVTYRPHWLPPGSGFGPAAIAGYFTLFAFVGLVWAGRRYRQMAADAPEVTASPDRTEILALAGLTAFAALGTVLTALFAGWDSTLRVPMREFTFIGLALLAATLYAGYRALTRRADLGPDGRAPAVRLSLPGEAVALGTLVLCGFATVLLTSAPNSGPVATGTETGDAETVFGPRLVGEPVAIAAFELEGDKRERVFGRVMSNLALDGERLVFGISVSPADGRVLCVNRATGKVEWALDDPDLKAVFCTPTVINGKVYCGEGMHEDRGRRLFCVGAGTGSPVWKEPFKTASHTEGAPAVAGGKVYFPAGDDGLYCADADTGAPVWQFKGGQEKGIHIDAAPVVSNGTVFVGSGLYSYVAVALDAISGAEKWRTDLGLRVFGQPLVSDGNVFYGVGTGNMGADVWHYDEEGTVRDAEAAGAVCCLDATTGKEKWRYPLPRSVHTGLAADAFSIYAGCRDGFVYALDRRTGKLRWKAGIGSSVTSAPAVAAEGGFPVAVYAVSREGRMFCLNPQTGAVVWWRGALPGYDWAGRDENNIMCTPLVLSTATSAGSKRTIYFGAHLTDPNPNVRHVAVFKFEDVIGE